MSATAGGVTPNDDGAGRRGGDMATVFPGRGRHRTAYATAHRRRSASTGLLVVLLAVARVSGAAVFVVDTTLDSVDALAGDGTCADAAQRCSLRAAIQESNALASEDSIVLGSGDFVLTIAGTAENAAASGDLDVTASVTLTGAGATASFIDGNALDRVLDVANGAVLRLRDVHVGGGFQAAVTGNAVEFSGGGLLVRSGGHAELADVAFEGNRSRRTGQAMAVFGSLRGERLRIAQNIGKDSFSTGGGLYIGSSATEVTLEDCTFDGNQAHQGGAIQGDGTATTIVLDRCLIVGNLAQGGGAIHANLGASRWLLRNTTISSNSADVGGALFGDGAHQLRLEQCTVTDNHASGPNGGGAIFDVRGSSGANFVPIALVNSIVAGNSQSFGRECNTVFPDVIVSRGGTLHAGGDACRMVAGSGDVVTGEAGLAPLADNGGLTRTHALRSGSAAIDTALDVNCPPVDQRHRARPVDGDGDSKPHCDIGAFEREDALFADGFEPA